LSAFNISKNECKSTTILINCLNKGKKFKKVLVYACIIGMGNDILENLQINLPLLTNFVSSNSNNHLQNYIKVMKKVLLSLFIICLSLPMAEQAQAQWSIGASYEIRDEDPTNGFGARIEKGILNFVPLVDFNMRAHFSYFNESNSLSRSGANIDGDLEAYDYGLALTAGIKIALVKPYVGVGIGAETFDFKPDNDGNEGFNESSFYWNGFGGIELTVLPIITPFIEYRLASLTSTDDIDYKNVGRFAVGLSLRF
jgi:opacity protein-like surface antigen